MDMQVPAIPGLDDMATHIDAMLAMVPANMELLFYRDDDEPAVMEATYPDGRVEVTLAKDRPASGPLEVTYPHHINPPTLATWRQIEVEPPEERIDVLLWQVLAGFTEEEGNTLIRIGYLNKAGQYIDSYASAIDGQDEVLDGVTHWSPLPHGPFHARRG